MPKEYGILGARKGMGLLPWSWAKERLSNSHGHWMTTVRPDGRPQATIIWGTWIDDRLYFGTSPYSRKARNLLANPSCVVSTESAHEAVIVEGETERVTDTRLLGRFRKAYSGKYFEDIDTQLFPVYVVRPRVAFGFISDAKRWAGSATRWVFDDEQR